MEGGNRKNTGKIGEGVMGTFVIAGLETSHNGDVVLAKELITAAKESGASAVKFQIFDSKFVSTIGMSKHELSFKSHTELRACADKLGIEYIAVPFCSGAMRFLIYELLSRQIEIPKNVVAGSLLLSNVNHYAKLFPDLRVFIRTPMLPVKDMMSTLCSISSVRQLVLLYCSYCRLMTESEASLERIRMLSNIVGSINVGFSDLIIGTNVSSLAVLAGAKVIEKNLTLVSSTDDLSAVCPDEFKKMVAKIREYEKILSCN